MAKPEGNPGKGPSGAPGQQKLHTMTRTNPETGQPESRDVTQEDWRTNHLQYEAEGWTRPSDDVETPEPTDPTV